MAYTKKYDQPLVQQTVERVRRDIWRSMHMGELITESEMMARFRLPRRLMRHVVHELTTIGFVEPVKGTGLKVASITFKNVRNSHGLRWAIDRYLIEQIKVNVQKYRLVDFSPMRHAFDVMRERAKPFGVGKHTITAEEAREYLEADLAFHSQLAITAGFAESLPVIDHLMTSVRLFSPSPLDSLQVVHDVLEEHEKILDSLENNKWSEAIHHTKEHYLKSMRRYFDMEGMFEEVDF
jgi:DNA-binding GntR family transcriptional regulator